MGEGDKPWYNRDVIQVIKKFTGEHKVMPAEPAPAQPENKPTKVTPPPPPPEAAGESEVSPELMKTLKQGLEKKPAKMDQEKWVENLRQELNVLHTSLGALIGEGDAVKSIADEIVGLGVQAKTAVMELAEILKNKKLRDKPEIPDFNKLSKQPPLEILEELFETLDPHDPEINDLLGTMENNIKISQGLGLELFTEMEMTDIAVKIKALGDKTSRLVKQLEK